MNPGISNEQLSKVKAKAKKFKEQRDALARLLHQIQGKFNTFKNTVEDTTGIAMTADSKLGDTGGKNSNEEAMLLKDKRIRELEEEVSRLKERLKGTKN